jgi:hypothetical protein
MPMDPKLYDLDELRRKLTIDPAAECNHVFSKQSGCCLRCDKPEFSEKQGEPWTPETARRRIGGTFGT